MNKEWKDKWVLALRSGEFQQHRGALDNAQSDKDKPTAFCCLGVLSELGCKVIDGGPDYGAAELSNEAINGLILMNDGKRGCEIEVWAKQHSFNEIADWIEEHL